MLDARAILHGQIWRIVTFLMWPLSGDLFLKRAGHLLLL